MMYPAKNLSHDVTIVDNVTYKTTIHYSALIDLGLQNNIHTTRNLG
ncbi:hypothetical protein DSUL_140087 [Desulfovibrionales bacterium]